MPPATYAVRELASRRSKRRSMKRSIDPGELDSARSLDRCKDANKSDRPAAAAAGQSANLSAAKVAIIWKVRFTLTKLFDSEMYASSIRYIFNFYKYEITLYAYGRQSRFFSLSTTRNRGIFGNVCRWVFLRSSCGRFSSPASTPMRRVAAAAERGAQS